MFVHGVELACLISCWCFSECISTTGKLKNYLIIIDQSESLIIWVGDDRTYLLYAVISCIDHLLIQVPLYSYVIQDCHQTCNQWNRSGESWDQQTYLIQDCCVIYYGQTLIKTQMVGVRMIVVFRSRLALIWSASFLIDMIWISYAEHTRWLLLATFSTV